MIETFKLDKSDWKLVKFGDVVKEPKETVKNPLSEGIEHVVGLEHIEPENIHLTQFASINESTTFTKKFSVGDVLFGRRRAYLKKAAQAKFEGICSGDITVMRVKNDKLLPELLPFIVQNEKFFDYAIEHSAGGLSPRVKFKDLANFEFLIPPKEQQEELAELLWSMDEVIEKELLVLEKLDIQFRTIAKYISDNSLHSDLDLKKIKEIAVIKDNLRKPLNSTERDKMKGEIPYYGANGMVDEINDFIFNEDLVLLAEDGGNFSEFYKKPIAYKVTGKSWVNNHAHVLTVRGDLCTIDWIYYSLVHKNLIKYIIGTTRVKLNKSELENVKIWIPDTDTMNQLISEMKKVEDSRELANNSVSSAKSLQKSIINEVF